MDWLNYHHLLYFWTVARSGSIARAGEQLRLTQPTISAQLRLLEEAFGEKLFRKQGRHLVMTEAGHTVYGYAEQIFALGQELVDTMQGRPTDRPVRLQVGIADAVPKLIAYRLLEPALGLEGKVLFHCQQDHPEALLAKLAVHELDLVISDFPVPPSSHIRAFNHLLGETGVTFFASADQAPKLRRTFPRSLDGAPVLMPHSRAPLRRALEAWFEAQGIRPVVAGEFEDSALMKVFGQAGVGCFAGPTAIAAEIIRQYRVRPIGATTEVLERFYILSTERRLQNPAVAALVHTARAQLFRP